MKRRFFSVRAGALLAALVLVFLPATTALAGVTLSEGDRVLFGAVSADWGMYNSGTQDNPYAGPVLWRVGSADVGTGSDSATGTMTMLTEYLIGMKAYDTGSNVAWSTASLNAFLNSQNSDDFLEHFNSDEYGAIQEQAIKGVVGSAYQDADSSNCRVFILSGNGTGSGAAEELDQFLKSFNGGIDTEGKFRVAYYVNNEMKDVYWTRSSYGGYGAFVVGGGAVRSAAAGSASITAPSVFVPL